MITLKDYAAQNNISYEAVRAQVNRFRDQLDEHVIRQGRQQYLDDVAVAFLNERRQKNPVVIYQHSKDEEIEQLRLEKEQLLLKLAAQSETLVGLMQYKLEAEEKRRALEDAAAAHARRESELQIREGQFIQELEKARQEAADAAKTAAIEEMAQELETARREAQELSEAKNAIETDLQGRISELEQYAAACREYNSLPAWRRMFRRAPEPPAGGSPAE